MEDNNDQDGPIPGDPASPTAHDRAGRVISYADAVVKTVSAISTSAVLLGSLWLIAISVQLPGGFPRLDGSALAALALPIAFVGVFFVGFLAVGMGFAGSAYNRFAWYGAARAYVPPGRETPVETALFLTLGVTSLLVLTGFELRHWRSEAMFAVPVAGWLAALVARARSGKIRTWRDAWDHRSAVASAVWFLPLLLAIVFAQVTASAQQPENTGRLIWLCLVVYVFAATATNYMAAVGGTIRASAFSAIVVFAVLVFAPKAILGMPLRALSWIDVVETIVVDREHADEARDVLRGCSALRRIEPGRYAVHVLDAMGEDVVIACRGDEWVTIPRDWIVARKPATAAARKAP